MNIYLIANNIILNNILKNTLCINRPNGYNYGMPSGHSQFMGLILFLYPNIFILILTILIMIQRVYKNYHSINQIIVGFLVGYFFGLLNYSYNEFFL